MEGIAVVPQGLEDEGAKELLALGVHSAKPLRRGVSFTADLACFYRLHLLARLPFRLLREMARFPCDGPESLYFGIQNALNWEDWLHPSMTFRVDVSGKCDGLTHSYFTALQVKNALVDQQKNIWGKRSSIDLNAPDICFHLHLNRQGAILSLDGSNGSLHKRGYRSALGVAPLKENLAAGLIRLSLWNGDMPLVDPMCGSGTFLIEAVSSMYKIAPGLNRSFSLHNWLDFDSKLWAQERNLSMQNIRSKKKLPLIIGLEKDAFIANQAKANVAAAGLTKAIKIQNSHFREFIFPDTPGLIVCNPPYGKRVGKNEDLKLLYDELGDFLKNNASGWQFWLLSGNPHLSRSLHMKASCRYSISNGGIDCRWLQYLIN